MRYYSVMSLIAVLGTQFFSGAQNSTADITASNGRPGRVCAEDFLKADAVHGGSDYGAAIDAAVRALPLKEPSSLEICKSGNHPVFTPIVFDRPIAFQMTGSKLVPQPSLSSVPVLISVATLTGGSKTVHVPSTDGLRVGMAIGGIGITSSTYISSIAKDSITLSLPAEIVVNGVATAGSPKLTSLSSMRGLAEGQTLAGSSIQSGAKIASLDYAAQSVTLSAPANGGSPIPASFSVGGTWTTRLKAVVTTPVIQWVFNQAALRNSEGSMIGGSMRDVWIASPTFRTLDGVQGVQIFGWDRFNSYNLQVEDLPGSALILGGYVPASAVSAATVRESFFYDAELRDSGDASTGQPVLELMTGTVPGYLSDDVNQIGFIGGQIAFYYGEGITIGSFNPAAVSVYGPRLLWFSDNFQIEGGSHVTGPPIDAPVDTVHILRGRDIFFDGDEIAAPGYGKSLIRLDNVESVSVENSLLYDRGKSVTFNVSTQSGSNQVHFRSGPSGTKSFDSSGAWDGVGAQISDGANCSPCNVYLRPEDSVDASGTTLSLASSFPGATTDKATITIGYGGYFINDTGPGLTKLTAMGNQYMDMESAQVKLLGLSSQALAWNVGSGFQKSNGTVNISDYHALNASSLNSQRTASSSDNSPVSASANNAISLGSPAQVGQGAAARCAPDHSCDAVSGEITLITGDGTLTGGPIAIVNFGTSRAATPNCSISVNGGQNFLAPEKIESKTSLVFRTAIALSPRTTYSLTYVCGN